MTVPWDEHTGTQDANQLYRANNRPTMNVYGAPVTGGRMSSLIPVSLRRIRPGSARCSRRWSGGTLRGFRFPEPGAWRRKGWYSNRTSPISRRNALISCVILTSAHRKPIARLVAFTPYLLVALVLDHATLSDGARREYRQRHGDHDEPPRCDTYCHVITHRSVRLSTSSPMFPPIVPP